MGFGKRVCGSVTTIWFGRALNQFTTLSPLSAPPLRLPNPCTIVKPVGWAEHDALALALARATFRAGRRACKKMGLPRGRPISRVGCYAVFLRAFAAGFGSILFWDLAFTLAANSCFTLRTMASVSTL